MKIPPLKHCTHNTIVHDCVWFVKIQFLFKSASWLYSSNVIHSIYSYSEVLLSDLVLNVPCIYIERLYYMMTDLNATMFCMGENPLQRSVWDTIIILSQTHKCILK